MSTPRQTIAILHYASAPVVGGVESTITFHARGLTALGYPVRVVSGSGGLYEDTYETHIDPLFGSTHPSVLAVKRELDVGRVPADFESVVTQIEDALRQALAGCDICIAHNVPTLHKNIPLSVALRRLQDSGAIRVIAWCHDLAWANAQYLPELHEGYPWDVLRQRWDSARYVTVSEARQRELAAVLGLPASEITVVLPGVDPAQFLHWTSTMKALDARLHLLDADGLLLVPARLTRRKNISLALRILAEIRRLSGRDYRLIVTGPPGPHNPANPGYLGELLELRHQLGITDAAHFLYEHGHGDKPLVPNDATMANLFQIADALVFPSLQEGFGIPILEAGLVALPVFCADIPPFQATGQQDVTYFDPVGGAPEVIAAQIHETLTTNPVHRLRLRVRQQFRWDVIIRERVIPLLEDC